MSKMKKDAEKELSWQVEVYLIFTRTRCWERTAAEDPESRGPGSPRAARAVAGL